MRDQHHRAAPGTQGLHRLHQCGLAHIVQVGVGLIQHHQGRLAINGPRQANALALTAREQVARFPHRRVVALGKAQNHLVQPRVLGRGNHLLRIHLAQAGDVFGNRALKQLDVLGQIPNIGPQLIAVPALDRALIEQHLPRHLRPNPQNAPRQR